MTFLDTPIFGFTATFIAFQAGLYINKKFKKAIFNPLIIAITLLIVTLSVFNIDYDTYNKGGSIITFFLGPATVVLAVPLYRQIENLKKNSLPILVGIFVGTITSIVSVIILSRIFGLSQIAILSLIPKSATTAISQEVSNQIGGIPALTIAATAVTGLSGNIMGPSICKAFKITDDTAVGISLGTISHVVGTAKAIEMGETQGAMGSLAVGAAGLATVFLAPWLLKIFI